jgi:hypothetical protein
LINKLLGCCDSGYAVNGGLDQIQGGAGTFKLGLFSRGANDKPCWLIDAAALLRLSPGEFAEQGLDRPVKFRLTDISTLGHPDEIT